MKNRRVEIYEDEKGVVAEALVPAAIGRGATYAEALVDLGEILEDTITTAQEILDKLAPARKVLGFTIRKSRGLFAEREVNGTVHRVSLGDTLENAEEKIRAYCKKHELFVIISPDPGEKKKRVVIDEPLLPAEQKQEQDAKARLAGLPNALLGENRKIEAKTAGDLAEHMRISGRSAPKREEIMNKFLVDIGWQEQIDGVWYPTEEGAKHCLRHDYTTRNMEPRFTLKWRVNDVKDIWDGKVPVSIEDLPPKEAVEK